MPASSHMLTFPCVLILKRTCLSMLGRQNRIPVALAAEGHRLPCSLPHSSLRLETRTRSGRGLQTSQDFTLAFLFFVNGEVVLGRWYFLYPAWHPNSALLKLPRHCLKTSKATPASLKALIRHQIALLQLVGLLLPSASRAQGF